MLSSPLTPVPTLLPLSALLSAHNPAVQVTGVRSPGPRALEGPAPKHPPHGAPHGTWERMMMGPGESRACCNHMSQAREAACHGRCHSGPEGRLLGVDWRWAGVHGGEVKQPPTSPSHHTRGGGEPWYRVPIGLGIWRRKWHCERAVNTSPKSASLCGKGAKPVGVHRCFRSGRTLAQRFPLKTKELGAAATPVPQVTVLMPLSVASSPSTSLPVNGLCLPR